MNIFRLFLFYETITIALTFMSLSFESNMELPGSDSGIRSVLAFLLIKK